MQRGLMAVIVAVGFVSAVTANDDESAVAKAKSEALRTHYAEYAGRCEFRDARQQPLTFNDKPVMAWTNDGDWSGDLFVWEGVNGPEVIGCILSGPYGKGKRSVIQEFHLLAADPISPSQMPAKYRWAPREGLKRRLIEGAPTPANSPVTRMAQMRQLLQDFSAHMEASGKWELRLLTRPLTRYQPKEGPVVDGALFTYVWTKGTDPELMLLVECRRANDEMHWYYAPVRFSNRELWLKHHDAEVWRGAVYNEAPGNNDLIYSTRGFETIDDPQPQ